MMAVLVYPNGRRENHLLSGVPRVGDDVQLRDTEPDEPPLVVEKITWAEVDSDSVEPSVVITVRPRVNGPNGP
jgi:hypothetical protein